VAQARATGACGFARHLLVGGVVVGGLLAGLVSAWLGCGWASRPSPRRPALAAALPFEAALERTRARYDSAPAAQRFYVAGKLAFDPVISLVAELPGSFGSVLDWAAGAASFRYCCSSSGRATRVAGHRL
jgi:hypothetical protein